MQVRVGLGVSVEFLLSLALYSKSASNIVSSSSDIGAAGLIVPRRIERIKFVWPENDSNRQRFGV